MRFKAVMACVPSGVVGDLGVYPPTPFHINFYTTLHTYCILNFQLTSFVVIRQLMVITTSGIVLLVPIVFILISKVTMAEQFMSQREKCLKIISNFKFRKINRPLSSGEVKWRCTVKTCRAFLKTVGDDDRITEQSLNHNHESLSDQNLQKQFVTGIVKRKATEDICTKPSKIFCNGIKNIPTEQLQVSDVRNIKRNIYNARRKILPPFPKSIEEIQLLLDERGVQTNRDELFLLINNKELKYIVFSCISNLKALALSKWLYIDGTFSYCPKYFTQMFIIHGFINGYYIPLAICLLSDKSTISYANCLKSICEYSFQNNIIISPSDVVIDFEKAIHLACNTVWPQIKIHGCRFHLAQSWNRSIQQNCISNDYKDKNSDIRRWLVHCYGLPFLSPGSVSEYFVNYLMKSKPDDERVTRFADYLVDVYISEEAQYPPEVWAEASAEPTLTTNACESFHSHFNSSFYTTHPNIFMFIEKLKEIQIEVYI
ncbi:hypothetical protein QTP88_000887 [Uroleucon formosanum]